MTIDEYRKAIEEVILLCASAIDGKVPDKERIASLNLEHLYKASYKHNLSAIVGYALESAGVFDYAFIQAKAKAIRKVAVMEIDKELLFERFEQEGIWYLPLKGTVIKDLYPSIGMRQMADFDILFDKNYQKKVRDIFIELGFYCKDFGIGDHDEYFKNPVSNFEMHTAMFGANYNKYLYEYYLDIKRLMQKDDNNKFGYHLSPNDFYIYITAHEYKHYNSGGTGLRSLLDTYIIWKRLGDKLDEDYIRSETAKLGIAGFEQDSKRLALDLFSGKAISSEDQEMLDYYIRSGTYGNTKNYVEHKIKKYGGGKKGKRKYIMSRIFMPMEDVKAYYPFYYRHKILLPALFFYRLGRAATVSRKKTKTQLKTLRKKK